MTLSLTCKACGTVLTAAGEDELAALGQRHAEEHGHDRPLSRAHILARIRRHNPPAPAPSDS
jgi:hypothetical protein